MKKYKNISRELMIILLLVTLKLSIFYRFIDFNTNVFVVVSGVLFTMTVFMVFDLLKEKYRDCLFIIFYTIFSFVTFADVVFFKYFNQLPSIVVLRQIGQLGPVTSSVKYLLKPVYFLLLLDIPLLFTYIIVKYKKKVKMYYFYNNMKKSKYPVLIMCIIWFLFIVVVDKSSEEISLRKQEVFTYHANDIFVSLFGNEENFDLTQALKGSHNNNKNNKFNGIVKGKNLIVIQVESLQNFVIGRQYNNQELTPNLNRLINNDSIYFNRYYQLLGRGNTSDAEFTTHNSLYPAMDGQTYTKYVSNDYYGLPWLLKDKGYNTIALHGYKGEFWNRLQAYPKQGFDKFIDAKGYISKKPIGFGVNDKEFLTQSIQYLKELKNPYYAFLITLSSHHPYDMPKELIKIKLNEEHKNTLFGRYLQSINFVDEAIGDFIEALKKQGLYEDSVIVIYGDHFGLSSMDEENKLNLTKYLGFDYNFDEMMRIPLIIHIPNSDIKDKIDTVGSQLDFYPTMLNLFGLDNSKGIMLGQDLINTNKGFVAQQTYMLKGSFIKDNIIFNMSRDGIFSHSYAWNYNDKSIVDTNNCREDYEKAIKQINLSNYILKNNLIISDLNLNDKDYENCNAKKEKLIAHAGGRLDGNTYTNCLEALNKSYDNQHRLIEVDFEWTTDGKLVCLHSWDGFVKKFFGKTSKKYSYDEFKNFKMMNGWHQLTIEDIAKWLREHKDARIVTDVKADNIKALKIIKEQYPDVLDNIIPQIYHIEEYIKVQELGYKDIILTLYMSNYSDEQIIDFVTRHDVYAITMPIDKAKTQLPKKLDEVNVFSYTHTVNEVSELEEFYKYGIDGFYTDDILPNQIK
ncbi:sulfatase-like hydrolase/transferase [Abyssisolibacter fermentans]|uniref:sulfatase-like hydrolase/transferase n=1 Tax=Abyssisolibacter fermentans TaxID=1766203 RepID=UPI00082C60E0|nr:sulfatase-like hydrolase/transferase [Abyssisolibacter fermentans]